MLKVEDKRIGLLGGTFDPVHNGHLAAADHALKALELDKVWFIPAAEPPHKAGHADGQKITAFKHRFNMLNLAVRSRSGFTVSDIELQRDTPSYSIDTLHELQRIFGSAVELFFVIGEDAFAEIDTWKQFAELPYLTSFVIISRPDGGLVQTADIIRQCFPKYQFIPPTNSWQSAVDDKSVTGGRPIYQLIMEPVAIASTDVRERVCRGQEIDSLVPALVAEYITIHKLYKNG